MAALLLAALSLAPAGDTVVIVLDDSGSMNYRMEDGSRLEAAKDALEAVLKDTPADTRIAVLLLNGRRDKEWVVPLDDAADRDAAAKAVRAVKARGGTPLGAAMKRAADALLAARGQDPRGQHRLLIVSDGEAGDGKLVEAYLPQIQARGLAVDVIGVAMDTDHSLATKVATYRSAADAESLQQAVADLVQGETSLDDGDAAADDFEMIAALPADVAAAAVEALGNPPDTPLQEPRRGGWFGGDGGGNAGGGGGNAGGGGGLGFGGIAALMVIVWLIATMVRAASRGR